ncbi:hypothetical protein C2G38_2057126 [Gigaspora rosea]|uniref:Uncharacterized protein n=1 Tax=Gigaspora rosea TaxID=44941 RepID=A0A397W3D5_9GLOM|nr:hypothetical protein C2G38_2057126 [Gigaspora rosea]
MYDYLSLTSIAIKLFNIMIISNNYGSCVISRSYFKIIIIQAHNIGKFIITVSFLNIKFLGGKAFLIVFESNN